MKKVFRTPYLARWIYYRRVWGFKNSNKVYLTFDDGPTSELTDWILDLLKKEGVKATFFCVGENAKNLPDGITRILEEGHSLGNHTMRHEKAWKTPSSEYRASIDEAAKHIPSKLFRPPYGKLPLFKGGKIARKYKIVMWSWLSWDFDLSVSCAEILQNARKQLRGGDILVLHDNDKVEDRLKIVLPELINIVRSKNLTFEVISF